MIKKVYSNKKRVLSTFKGKHKYLVSLRSVLITFNLLKSFFKYFLFYSASTSPRKSSQLFVFITSGKISRPSFGKKSKWYPIDVTMLATNGAVKKICLKNNKMCI